MNEPAIKLRVILIEAIVFGLGFPVIFSLLAIARGFGSAHH